MQCTIHGMRGLSGVGGPNTATGTFVVTVQWPVLAHRLRSDRTLLRTAVGDPRSRVANCPCSQVACVSRDLARLLNETSGCRSDHPAGCQGIRLGGDFSQRPLVSVPGSTPGSFPTWAALGRLLAPLSSLGSLGAIRISGPGDCGSECQGGSRQARVMGVRGQNQLVGRTSTFGPRVRRAESRLTDRHFERVDRSTT